MKMDTNILIPMTEANQDFSKVVRLVDEAGMAVILEDNKPGYIVLSFQDYEDMQAARLKRLDAIIDDVIAENLEALLELAQ